MSQVSAIPQDSTPYAHRLQNHKSQSNHNQMHSRNADTQGLCAVSIFVRYTPPPPLNNGPDDWQEKRTRANEMEEETKKTVHIYFYGAFKALLIT
jgi:hypothetical protein